MLVEAPLTEKSDLYNEVFEIIDSCTFSAKAISNTMWQIFELIHKSFKDSGEIYIEGKFVSGDNIFFVF